MAVGNTMYKTMDVLVPAQMQRAKWGKQTISSQDCKIRGQPIMGPESQCSVDRRADKGKAKVQERASHMEYSIGKSTHKFLEVKTKQNNNNNKPWDVPRTVRKQEWGTGTGGEKDRYWYHRGTSELFLSHGHGNKSGFLPQWNGYPVKHFKGAGRTWWDLLL